MSHNSVKSFKDFYESIGLQNFPFNTFTTENEVDFAEQVFVSQGEYDPIFDAFKLGRNVIILGERGSGKTAILEDFKRHLKTKNHIASIINDFSEVSEVPSESEIYKLLVSNFLIELFSKIAEKPRRLRRLNKEEKTILSYFLVAFLPVVSLNLLKDRIANVQLSFWKRAGIQIYNALRGPLNFTGTVAQNLTYQYILKHFSYLPPIETDSQIQEYFPELKIEVDYDFFDQDISFRLLKRLGNLSRKLGFIKPVLLLDRLDEDARFENDAVVISKFLSPFLTNTNLLSINEFQVVVFVWSTPFRFIEELVRSQKYYCPHLKWRRDDLEQLLNQRLKISSNHNIKNYRSLFDSEVEDHFIEEVFKISNSNPRDLLHVFKILFEEQFRTDPSSRTFSMRVLNKGLRRFVLDFNYYEYYPRKSKARANSMDIYSYSAHLLKLSTSDFTKNQLNEQAGTGSSTNNYVVGMERIGLIENIGQERGYAVYRIKDPKIIFCQKNNLELRK